MENQKEILFVYIPNKCFSASEKSIVINTITDFFIRNIGYEPYNYHDNEIENYENLMCLVEHAEKLGYGFKMCRKVVEVYDDISKETSIKVKMSSRKESLMKALEIFINEKLIE